MVRTQREKYIRRLDDGALINDIHSHANRGMDRVISALGNLQIVSYNPDPEKVASARDYMIKALENVSILHFALIELYARYRQIRIEDKKKAEYIKDFLKQDLPEPDEIEMPRFLFSQNSTGSAKND